MRTKHLARFIPGWISIISFQIQSHTYKSWSVSAVIMIDVSLKHDTEVSQRFNYMHLSAVLCACGIFFFLYWVGTEFSCGWQFNPLQFSKWLDLFCTRFQQMWLDCLIGFGHFGLLVYVHVWAIISISHSSNPSRTQSSFGFFVSSPRGSNQLSPLNPLPTLLSHKPHVHSNYIHRRPLWAFLDLHLSIITKKRSTAHVSMYLG